jgi:proline-specific peptidase
VVQGLGTSEVRGQLPLLVLHGGPGVPHDYLEPLEDLAASGRRVIFYDQLGCGNSDHPKDKSLWTVNLFVDEIRAVREHLGLDRIHLLGHCWGGMLAMEYMLTQPSGVESLIVSNSPASMAQFVEGTRQLRAQLPADVQETLTRSEATGATQTKAYQDAVMTFYKRHLVRMDTWPEYVTRAFEKFAAAQDVYSTLKGASELTITGTLKNWDIRNRLGDIHVPTLVIGGRYDETLPEVSQTVQQGISGAEWALFENSSHCPFVEERARYIQVVDTFIGRIDANIAETERIEAVRRVRVAA